MTTVGKVICSGFIHAPVYDNQGNEVDNQKCPFCRTPFPATDEEIVEREKKRVKLNDPIAIYNLGMYYQDGVNGFPQDYDKALELFLRAGELGYSQAYGNIGNSYNNGRGVEVDETKARYYYGLSAMMGDATARHNLGVEEVYAGNKERALKHFMIAVRGGYSDSLKNIQRLYSDQQATKEDYMKALQLYQTCLVRLRSCCG